MQQVDAMIFFFKHSIFLPTLYLTYVCVYSRRKKKWKKNLTRIEARERERKNNQNHWQSEKSQPSNNRINTSKVLECGAHEWKSICTWGRREMNLDDDANTSYRKKNHFYTWPDFVVVVVIYTIAFLHHHPRSPAGNSYQRNVCVLKLESRAVAKRDPHTYCDIFHHALSITMS